MGSIVLKGLLLLLGGLLVLLVLIRINENKLVFFPTPFNPGGPEPRDYRLQHQELAIGTQDGETLHGWLFRVPRARGLVIFMHGNAGNMQHRLDLVARLLQAVPTDVLLFDYRGYGKSTGRPSEEGIKEDARAVYRFVCDSLGLPASQIVLYGRSLGGAFAAGLAAEVPVAGVILEATFSSGRDMARLLFPFLPVGLISGIRLDSAAALATVSKPKLFIHGTADDIVPYELGRKLYAAAAPPKKWIDVAGAGHNDVYVVGGEIWISALRDFMTDLFDASETLR